MKELVAIQNRLNAPKDLFNKFGNYKYRSCESILAAVKPLLDETKCTLVISDEIIMVGTRVYVKATATLTNEKGESTSSTAYAREEESKKGMDASQVTGSTSSYARKYALNGLFAIDDVKDADATNTHGVDEKKANNNSSLLEQAKADAKTLKNRSEFAIWWARFAAVQKEPEMVELAKQLGAKFPKQQ